MQMIFQVESVETVGGNPLSDLIVVAEVLACAAHPNADHLRVCRVTDGRETFQVVCGAPNMRAGIKTAFAKIGAPIPAFLDKNGNPEKIRKGKLRGVRSLGLVVDVTNYVLLELGAPLHAFDYTKLADRTVVVRCARDGETIRTLDGVTRALQSRLFVRKVISFILPSTSTFAVTRRRGTG